MFDHFKITFILIPLLLIPLCFPTSQLSFPILPQIPLSLCFLLLFPSPYPIHLIFFSISSPYADMFSVLLAQLCLERWPACHRTCGFKCTHFIRSDSEWRQKRKRRWRHETLSVECAQKDQKLRNQTQDQSVFVTDGVDVAGPYTSGDRVLFVSTNELCNHLLV